MDPSAQNRSSRPASGVPTSDQLRPPPHIDGCERPSVAPVQINQESESPAVASVHINHPSLKHLTKQLEDPAVQARIRAKYGDSRNRLKIELGKNGHFISGNVLTLQINQERELRKFLKPEATENAPATSRSLDSQFFTSAAATLRVILLKGLKGEAPRQDIVKLARFMTRFEQGSDCEKKIFQTAMQNYEQDSMMGASPSCLERQSSPTKHFYRFQEQCDRNTISPDTQAAFRDFLKAFCRALPLQRVEEEVTASINSSSKLFQPCPGGTLEKLVTMLPHRRNALNDLTALALLSERSLAKRLNSAIVKGWEKQYSHFTDSVKDAFFSSLTRDDYATVENVCNSLRMYANSLATPGTNQYLMTSQVHLNSHFLAVEGNLHRFLREIPIFVQGHREMRKTPLTENEALDLVERSAEACLEWLAAACKDPDIAVPECAETCAHAIAQIALATGGPQQATFCEIIREILQANEHVNDPAPPGQVYCMLASFKEYVTFISNEEPILRRHAFTRLGFSLVGTLDVIATGLLREITASNLETPLSDIEGLLVRLTNVISLLQRPFIGITEKERLLLSARLNAPAHAVESRRFTEYLSAGKLLAAAESLSRMRDLRAGFEGGSKADKLEAEMREREAKKRLIAAADKSMEILGKHLNNGHFGKAFLPLQELINLAERLPDCIGTQFGNQLSIHRDTFEKETRSYWTDVVQPQIAQAAQFVQERKKSRRLEEPLSSEEESCLVSLVKDVREIKAAWRGYHDASSSETAPENATPLDALLDDLRNRYNMIVSEWSRCPAAHAVFSNGS